MCGDFNSHHRTWYGHQAILHQSHLRRDAKLADDLVERLFDLSLVLRNEPGTYTHFPRNGSSPSVIDLTFTRGQSCEDVLDWTLGDDFGSDHLSTHLHLHLDNDAAPIVGLAWSKTNWGRFTAVLDEAGLDFDSLGSHGEIERAAENYAKALHKAIDEAVPKIHPTKRRKARGWWNADLDVMSKTVKDLQKASHQDPTNEELAKSARTARNARRNALREAKQSYTMLKLQQTNPRDVWKVLRQSKPAHTKAIPPLDDCDRIRQETFEGKCNTLRSALFPAPAAGSDIPNLRPPKADLRESFTSVTPGEIRSAINRCNRNSACGYDRIPYLVIDKAHAHRPDLLTHLFESSITIGYFPVAWKRANCVVIPKGGKHDPHMPRSYRPISLLSNISKVFEKLVAKRIAQAAIEVGALSSTQFGAIENRSAIDALFAITHPASEALATRVRPGRARPDRPTLLTNDIRGAFNNTDPTRLVRIMQARRMPEYLWRWVSSFTADHTLAFCFDGKAETPQPYESGLPQGSPASPVLFLIYAQALLEAPGYMKDKDVSYLDDDGLLQLSTAQPFAVRRLKERMELRLQRGVQLNLPYDTAKSGLIHFWPLRNNQKPTNPTSQPAVEFSGAVIKPRSSIKHLGVHLDDSLTFHTHSDDAAARGSQCLGLLASLRHNHRGLSVFTALHLVRTAFLPKLLWASPVWWTGSQHILSRLEPIYHRALRWASGLPAYMAIRKLLLLTRCPPLHALLDHLSARYAIRLLFAAADHPLQEYIGLSS